MHKKIILLLLLLVSFVYINKVVAQQTAQADFKTYKVAIFAPLYLDSVFTDGNYSYGKSFPKFAIQALDFVQGAQIALDSMPLYNANIDATIYDSKSFTQPIPSLITAKNLDSVDLIIGSVKDEEFVELAAFAQRKNIPFISASYPNDGGSNANPFLAIVNSTLKAHCEAIYSYLLQSHGTDKIFLVRKPGSQEDKVAEYFKNINAPDGKPLLNIQTLDVQGDFSFIKNKLDSNRQTIIIGGSLNEEFASKLAATCFSLNKKYHVTLIGMPNWDNFSFINKKNGFKDYPVYYTSPYYNYKNDNQSKMIQALYKKKFKGTPSDMTYKGFETIFVFCRLLAKYPE
ncbi:MAG: ABC transporter substrate-binding protein, partial [Ferruginibacter sp.]